MPRRPPPLPWRPRFRSLACRCTETPAVPGSQELADGGPEGGFDLGPGKKSYSVSLVVVTSVTFLAFMQGAPEEKPAAAAAATYTDRSAGPQRRHKPLNEAIGCVRLPLMCADQSPPVHAGLPVGNCNGVQRGLPWRSVFLNGYVPYT